MQVGRDAAAIDDQAAEFVLVDAIYPCDCLHQPLTAHRLVDVLGVQRRGVEAGQPHVVDDHQLERISRVYEAFGECPMALLIADVRLIILRVHPNNPGRALLMATEVSNRKFAVDQRVATLRQWAPGALIFLFAANLAAYIVYGRGRSNPIEFGDIVTEAEARGNKGVLVRRCRNELATSLRGFQLQVTFNRTRFLGHHLQISLETRRCIDNAPQRQRLD